MELRSVECYFFVDLEEQREDIRERETKIMKQRVKERKRLRDVRAEETFIMLPTQITIEITPRAGTRLSD